jgi:2-polyprenyl-6-methoxyphenol hydroxylase-like FAD-dependent oxidoreductase
MYDVIVVGARVSGSPTAMLLARAGHRILLVDRATFPSAKPPATNLIHPPGVLRLKRWGLLDEVLATGCPPITHYGLESGPARLMAPLPPAEDVAFALSPERETLDEILVRAAGKAGAELWEGADVHRLLTDDGAVTGIEVRGRGGDALVARARVVVGADGSNSKVARLVDAAKYRARGVLNKSSWTYWSDLPHDGKVRTYRHRHRHAFTWPTHDGLTIVGVAWPTADFAVRDPDATERAVVEVFDDVDPDFAQRLRETKRADRWMTGAVPNFLRAPAGQGWALVGDAGYTRDPITAAGIMESLRSAELLAEVIDDGLSGRRDLTEALAGYGQRRDDLVTAHYEYTCDYATVADHSAEELEFIQAMTRSPVHAAGMVGVFAGSVTPQQFYSRASIHDLLDYVPRGRDAAWRVRFVRWLVKGVPGRLGPARRLGDRLIAGHIGAMGKYLLAPGSG